MPNHPPGVMAEKDEVEMGVVEGWIHTLPVEVNGIKNNKGDAAGRANTNGGCRNSSFG